MRFAGASAIVTGAGQGIGRALAEDLSRRGTRVLVSDRSFELAEAVAQKIGGVAHFGDLRDLTAVGEMIAAAETAFGDVDMLFSNAGFATGEPNGPTSAKDVHWQDSWDVHVMAHLRASRILIPKMEARGAGVLVNVASAAGVLSQIGDAAYSATKHAAVSLAQSLAIEHGDSGIQVSVVCPLYVATPLLGYADATRDDLPQGVISSEAVAASILQGIEAGKFMIYPHPEAQNFFSQRAADTDRWIAAMQRLRRKVLSEANGTDPASIHRFI